MLPLTVGIYEGFENYISHLRPEQVCKPDAVPKYPRTLADLRILCRALKSQGVSLEITLKFFPNNRRSMKMVESGAVNTLVPSNWRGDIISTNVLRSSAVIKKGQFEKGVYVHEKHPLLKRAGTDIDFTKYMGVSVKSWKLDWEQLSMLTANRIDIGHLPAIYGMLANGRADFTFLEFTPSKNMESVNSKGVRLLPIQGVKIQLNDSRHFVVSKQFENSVGYLSMLDKGLKTLAESNEIEAIYQDAGVILSDTKDWRVLNQPW